MAEPGDFCRDKTADESDDGEILFAFAALDEDVAGSAIADNEAGESEEDRIGRGRHKSGSSSAEIDGHKGLDFGGRISGKWL